MKTTRLSSLIKRGVSLTVAGDFAGIGNRDLPVGVYSLLSALGTVYATQGYVLRSGGARGADNAFQEGYEAAVGRTGKIFLPRRDHTTVPKWQHQLIRVFHPNPDALRHVPYCLMARNCEIILGKDGNDPVEFVACWAVSEHSGGSAFGIRLARWAGIPVVNLCPNPEPDRLNRSKSMAYKFKKK